MVLFKGCSGLIAVIHNVQLSNQNGCCIQASSDIPQKRNQPQKASALRLKYLTYLPHDQRLDTSLIQLHREHCATRDGLPHRTSIDRHHTPGPAPGMPGQRQTALDRPSHQPQSISRRDPRPASHWPTQHLCHLHFLQQLGRKQCPGKQTIQQKRSLRNRADQQPVIDPARVVVQRIAQVVPMQIRAFARQANRRVTEWRQHLLPERFLKRFMLGNRRVVIGKLAIICEARLVTQKLAQGARGFRQRGIQGKSTVTHQGQGGRGQYRLCEAPPGHTGFGLEGWR
ncbi:hypothetical protein WR25_00706 [Diploscapter pachys]|uniref:Uncharacterized protein n=1 Tax=Diploscapter pachys TaxID=2018661 RepID=A0A2A2KIQ9_9BILA|nr:hypothetical protein WR25_00706 [Diploscapter pachys]